MARLEIPLIGRKIASTGDIVLRAELDLLLRARDDTLRSVTFRVDTATDMSTMPAWLARQFDLPLPKDRVPNLTHASGLAVRNGLLPHQGCRHGPGGVQLPLLFPRRPRHGPGPVSISSPVPELAGSHRRRGQDPAPPRWQAVRWRQARDVGGRDMMIRREQESAPPRLPRPHGRRKGETKGGQATCRGPQRIRREAGADPRGSSSSLPAHVVRRVAARGAGPIRS